MQLKGCVNDAMRMQMVLVDRFGFKAENIRELHDEAATREAILGGLDWLAEVAEEDDIVVFQTRSCDPPMANGSTRLKAPALTAR
jgi:hypothetical protein